MNQKFITRKTKRDSLYIELDENDNILNTLSSIHSKSKQKLLEDNLTLISNNQSPSFPANSKSKKISRQNNINPEINKLHKKSIFTSSIPSLPKTGCNCKNSKCLKRYCECFIRNKRCDGHCSCINCSNNLEKNEERDKAVKSYLNKSVDIFRKKEFENTKVCCTCKKSNCNKKYCECYQLGKKCNIKCRCENCFNYETNNFENNELGKGLNSSICNSINVYNNFEIISKVEYSKQIIKFQIKKVCPSQIIINNYNVNSQNEPILIS